MLPQAVGKEETGSCLMGTDFVWNNEKVVEALVITIHYEVLNATEL